jgi:Sigma-70, region 4
MSAALHLPVLQSTRATRADCLHPLWPSPCDVQSCRYHLPRVPAARWRVKRRRELPEQSSDSCALAVVDQHGALSLDAVGTRLGVTRERIRQIERGALSHLRAECRSLGVDFEELIASWDSVRG